MLIDKQWLGALVKSQFSRDLLYTFISQIFVMLSVFLVNKLMSIGQTLEGYAVYSLIRKNAALFASLFALGLNEALARYYAFRHGRHSNPIIFSSLLQETLRLLLISILSFLVLFIIFHELLSNSIFDSPDSFEQLGLVYLFAVSTCLYNLLCSYYQGQGDFKRTAFLQMGVNGCYIIASCFLYNEVKTLFVVWSMLTLLPLTIVLLKELRVHRPYTCAKRKPINRLVRKRLLFYGISRMGSNIMMYAIDVLPLVIILHMFGRREVSLFTASTTILLIVTPLFAFTSNIFLQRVSLLKASGNYTTILKLVGWAAIPFLLIAVLGGGFLYLFSDLVVRLLYTEEFLDATQLIAITSIALAPKSIFFLLKSPIDAFSAKPYSFGIMIVSLLLYIVVLLSCKSLPACAWNYVLINFVMMLLSIAVWFKLLHPNFRVKYPKSDKHVQ